MNLYGLPPDSSPFQHLRATYAAFVGAIGAYEEATGEPHLVDARLPDIEGDLNEVEHAYLAKRRKKGGGEEPEGGEGGCAP